MNFNDLRQFYGSVTEAAHALGLHRQAVYRWKGRKIPLDKQIDYEIDSHGKLRADIPAAVRRNDEKLKDR